MHHPLQSHHALALALSPHLPANAHQVIADGDVQTRAAARAEEGGPAGALGQGGVFQLRDAQPQGVLLVDPDGPHRCRLAHRLPDAPDACGIYWSEAVSLPLSPASALFLSPRS
ncbi:hypothetical protein FJU31_03120 [Stenotrophomonas cyclobalanopsidis]|uniref:Uncharacterized protein n=1 Tax=Stenotrophomonas cyclobalanopsidis TaxID=2771362 RepID=A0ABQ6T559_9GAMM|nr:hypothetical protein [Stenotrophomonas cyclobalanopsidis]KAA9003859.1 hypothetical protein FJU31_03120 [Stenotrophomonas cyclobalanopsidis]